MKKALLLLLATVSVLAITSCSKTSLEKPFPTLEDVNTQISALTEVNDVDSAAKLTKILEDYHFLDDYSQTKVTDIQRIKDSMKTASQILNNGEDLTLKVMSFNIRYAEMDNGRPERVLQHIRNVDPDIFGVQEGTEHWDIILKENLSDVYGILGHGANQDKVTGDFNFVFYKKDKFNLLESATYWLTDTPTRYSMHSNSDQPRILTYQLLERKIDGQKILHVNIHLDHIGQKARVYQAEKVTNWIAKNFSDVNLPIIITGDFNTYSYTEEFAVFVDSDFKNVNRDGVATRTFNAYDPSGTAGGLIDFILFKNDRYTEVTYTVTDETMNGEFISDHNAIVSEMIFLPVYDSIKTTNE